MTDAAHETIKVLVVDDSGSSRVMLRRIVESDPGLQVMATAADAFAAAQQLKLGMPDVILLDVEMPGMDGITFLRKIMQQRPIPVVICSALTETGSRRSLEALEAGALDVVLKPATRDPAALAEATARICQALRGAAQSRRRGAPPPPARASLPAEVTPKLTADEILPPPNPRLPVAKGEPVVCIGASTGGTEALRAVLCALPADAPPVLVVQHMPKGFTAAFANRLNAAASIQIREARDGMGVSRGEAVIGAGDSHLLLQGSPAGYRLQVSGGPAVCRHRPSVDVLFRSAATVAGQNVLGVILTGMGDDGARCLGEIRAAGGMTLAQDEASCIVYGMPREAVRMGHVVHSLPLHRIAAAIMAFAQQHRASGAAA